MSSIGHAASSLLTPTSRFHAIQTPGFNPSKQAREYNSLQLNFNSVAGTTTDSVNAFDTAPERHAFAYCAGSAVVLSHVGEHLNITQRFFRARPHALSINETPSFYNPATPPSTPGKNRHGSPLKDRGCGIMNNGLLDQPIDYSSQSRVNNRSRETSCVSLSREGILMAVGEVIWPAPRFAVLF